MGGRTYANPKEQLYATSVLSDEDSCWEWVGYITPSGYGRLKVFGRPTPVLAHVLSCEVHVGPVPKGACVLHTCDNPTCINPNHLWLGSRADNNRDMAAKGRASRGDNHFRAKLTTDDVRAIKAALAEGVSRKELGIKYNVSTQAITDIARERTWKHVTPKEG